MLVPPHFLGFHRIKEDEMESSGNGFRNSLILQYYTELLPPCCAYVRSISLLQAT